MKEQIKVIAKYDTDELTQGESYDVISIDSTTIEIRANGKVTVPETRKYMLEILCDTGESKMFMVEDFIDEVRILRDIKLCVLSDNSIINKVNRKLSASELLNLVSYKSSGTD